MKRMIIKMSMLVALMVLVAGVVFAENWHETQNVDKYAVTLTLSTDQPKKGDNSISVIIKDNTGTAVNDAQVTIEYSMHCMSGSEKTVFTEGEYKGILSLSMAGGWTISVKIERSGESYTAPFKVKVK